MQLEKNTVYLLLGSNLGDSKKILINAMELIGSEVGTVATKSSFYETAAWGKTGQPNFINIGVKVMTSLDSKAVLTNVLAIENKLGRRREEKWGARLIDIDVIFYNDDIIDEMELKVPHPEMHKRKFVLMPLAEIAPNYQHPIFKEKISTMLTTLNDELFVAKI